MVLMKPIFNFSLVMLDLYKMREQGPLSVRGAKNMTENISRDGSSLVARRAHNPKVGGSNPSPATICLIGVIARSA